MNQYNLIYLAPGLSRIFYRRVKTIAIRLAYREELPVYTDAVPLNGFDMGNIYHKRFMNSRKGMGRQ